MPAKRTITATRANATSSVNLAPARTQPFARAISAAAQTASTIATTQPALAVRAANAQHAIGKAKARTVMGSSMPQGHPPQKRQTQPGALRQAVPCPGHRLPLPDTDQDCSVIPRPATQGAEQPSGAASRAIPARQDLRQNGG